MAKKIEFSAENVKPLIAWFKRFASIDNSLLLEIDESTSMMLAKTYNEERSVVKFSKIKFEDAGLTTKTPSDPKRIKVGLFNIPRLIKIMDQFSDDAFGISISYDEVVGGDTTDYAGLSITLKNKNLKVTVDCTSLSIFKYIPDDLFKTVIANLDDTLVEFPLRKNDIDKTNSLCGLDTEHKYVKFSKRNNVYVSGKSFEYLLVNLGEDSGTSEGEIQVFKEQFNNLDVESYKVEMGDDRLVFTSQDSETITVISMVEE